MTIEVRQMVIRSTVGADPAQAEGRRPALPPGELERIKEEILAECRRWMTDKLQEARER
jgi:hypothetical protein